MFVSQVTACLRERGRDGCLSGIQVQQLFCSQNTCIPEHQLKELNAKIDHALQVSTHRRDDVCLLYSQYFFNDIINVCVCFAGL